MSKPVADKAAVAKPSSDKAGADKPAGDKASADKPNAEKAGAEKQAAVSSDRPASDKAPAEKATGETAAGASATAAASANVEKARQHFQRAIDSYRDGDLATALIEFKRAYSTAPNYRLLYNLGQVSADLRDYPAAERYLNQYLEESKSALDESRKLAVQDELAKVRARIASVHLTSNVEGTEVLVDDVLVGRTPMQAPIHVSTGRRRITGRAPGHAPVTHAIDAAGGEDVSVTLHLQPIPSTLADRQQAPAPVYRRGGTRKPLLLGLAIGAGVLAAGGVVFGYLAESDAVEYRSALQRKTSGTELKSLADGAKTYALVTDFLIGAALLTATVGTVVLLSSDIEAREQATTQVRLGLGNIELTKKF
ncbi:MAG TPA: PEGA domain-containing protein [Polyangiales bacterium]|nr:PEGA domain-containing protein [Polyangiales bacterium]